MSKSVTISPDVQEYVIDRYSRSESGEPLWFAPPSERKNTCVRRCCESFADIWKKILSTLCGTPY
jgi:hypothetical protein